MNQNPKKQKRLEYTVQVGNQKAKISPQQFEVVREIGKAAAEQAARSMFRKNLGKG